MKNLTLFLIVFLTNLCLFSQNRQDYYVVVKPNYSLEPIQRITNSDETLTLDLQDNNLEAFFNSKPIFYIEKAFPTVTSQYLLRVYRVTLDNDTHLDDFFDRDEIEYVCLTGNGDPLFIPDDYTIISERASSELNLIKAPLA